jgi:hypothetical protein
MMAPRSEKVGRPRIVGLDPAHDPPPMINFAVAAGRGICAASNETGGGR